MNREKTKARIEGPFLTRVRESFGDTVLSVMAYGSFVSGEFAPGVSDVNILIILQESDSRRITDFGRRAHSLIRRCRITPLVLTRSEFLNSADVFPMEYLDIKTRHILLHGRDETESLVLTRENLRHQLEENLRGTVATLRQVLIASKGRKRVIKNSLKNLFGSVKTSFRGIIELKEKSGENIPRESDRLLERLERDVGIDSAPFQKLLDMRRGGKFDPQQLADDVLSSLRELITIVDGLS